MTTTLIKSPIEQAIEAIQYESVLSLVNAFIYPQLQFVGESITYNDDRYKNGAIDTENLLISVALWAKNILSFDDFSKNVTRKLLKYQEKGNSFWDDDIEEFLDENGYNLDEFEMLQSAYTYNDVDYNRLDRDIHYTTFKYNGEYYVCFSIHYGCDARSGFSEFVVLKIQDYDYFFHSMQINGYYEYYDEDRDLQWYEIERQGTYRKESNTWYHNENGAIINIYSSADGY